MKKKTKSKFGVIFRKELTDLITVQTLIPIVLMFVIFYYMGDIIGSLTNDNTVTIESGQPGEEITVSTNSMIGVIDNDNSALSNYVKENLHSVGITPVYPKSTDPEEAMNELKEYDFSGEEVKIQTLVVINQGFGEKILSGDNTPVPVDIYSSVDSFSLTSMIAGASSQSAVAAINTLISQKLFDSYADDSSVNLSYITAPIYANDYTYLNSKTENVNASMVLNYVSSQTMLLPLIIFFIIMMSTQMLAASIVNEKTDKTLETLMTAPLNRLSVLAAKILSASIYAVLYAAAYSISYKKFMDSLSGGGTYPESFMSALEKFGITFNATAFAVIGVQLFLSVLCGLAVSMLIGMMIEDMKTLQAYLMPLIFVIMIPYLLSMFLDINKLPVIAKVLVYILPFTHTFTAAANLFMQNYTLLAVGIVYQVIFVAVLLTFAVKIFNSDKLFTLGQIMKKKPGKSNGSPFGKFKLFARK